MAAFTPIMIAILLSGTVYNAAFAAEQCNGPRQASIYGKMLRGHTYNKRFAPSGHAECLFTCRLEDVCQSFNFVMSKSVCEYNNRTKEASPENFVNDSERYYVKLDVRRVPLGSIPELPAKSCQEIKDNEEGQAVSGNYWFYSIIPATSVFAYCNMTTNDIDECSASPSACHVYASCENNDGSYVCTCHPGFTGNGKRCSDIDECASDSHGCHANASCTNTVGSYSCDCNSPLYGDGKSECTKTRGLHTSSILNTFGSWYRDKLITFLEPELKNSTRSRLLRCWRAASDGWAASTFHSRCDGKGPTVTIIKVGSYLFGGYTNVSWHSRPCRYATDNNAFIYSLYNIYGNNPVKLKVKSGSPYAICRCYNRGPTFGGGHDIYISDNAGSHSRSYTNCGHSYPLPAGYSIRSSCTFYAGGYSFTPTDVEVFYETTS